MADDNAHDPGDDPHAARFGMYASAAEQAASAHPLAGEDLGTPYLEDAQMWHAVYTELLTFKERLLDDTRQALETLPPPARDDVAKTDAVILEAEAQRFRTRLALWERRIGELGARG